MQFWTALDKNGWSIVTILAESEKDAEKRIQEQLDRPGRRGYLKEWTDAGKPIKEKGE